MTLESRNRCVAAYLFESIRNSLQDNPELILDEAYELWRFEISRPDRASGRLIALGSQLIGFDPLALATSRIKTGDDVFRYLHLVKAAFPYLEKVDLDSLIELCLAKYDFTKNDLLHLHVHESFRAWLSRNNDEAQELYRRLKSDIQMETGDLMVDVVIAISNYFPQKAVEYAIDCASSSSQVLSTTGVWILGRLLFQDSMTNDDIDALESNLMKYLDHPDDEMQLQAIRAATHALHITRSFDEALKSKARNGNPHVLVGVATAFHLEHKAMLGRDDLDEWLEIMTCISTEDQRALKELDGSLSILSSTEVHVDRSINFLTEWLHCNESKGNEIAEIFNTCLQNLLKNEYALSKLLTDWIIRDEYCYPRAVKSILGYMYSRKLFNISLNKSCIDTLNSNDLLFLARRILGYVFFPKHIFPLCLSMLSTIDAESRTFPLVFNLLVDEIGYDFPSSTIDFCKENSDNPNVSSKVKKILEDVASTIESNMKINEALPYLSYLRPPQATRRLFERARNKQMEKVMEGATKNSVLYQLATRITLKAGGGSFQFLRGGYSDISHLSTISHSVEIPRREVLDPVGYAIRNLHLRLAKRGSE